GSAGLAQPQSAPVQALPPAPMVMLYGPTAVPTGVPSMYIWAPTVANWPMGVAPRVNIAGVTQEPDPSATGTSWKNPPLTGGLPPQRTLNVPLLNVSVSKVPHMLKLSATFVGGLAFAGQVMVTDTLRSSVAEVRYRLSGRGSRTMWRKETLHLWAYSPSAARG